MKKRLIVIVSLISLVITACGSNATNTEENLSDEVEVGQNIEVTEENNEEIAQEESENSSDSFELYPDSSVSKTFILGIGNETGVSELLEVDLPEEYAIAGLTYEVGDIPAINDGTYLAGDFISYIDTGKVHDEITFTAPTTTHSVVIDLIEGNMNEYVEGYETNTLNGYEVAYKHSDKGYLLFDNAYYVMIQIDQDFFIYSVYAQDELNESEALDFVEAFLDTIAVIE